jgi:lysozyme family protein
MENNNTKTLLNEGVIQNMFKTMFGKSFKSTIAAASEGLLNVALTKVIGGGKKFSVSALRKTPEYQKALIDLVNEASVVRHQISFDELSNLKNKDLAKKLVKDVQEGIEKEITNNAATGKNLIDADVKVSRQIKNDAVKQGGDITASTKQWKADVKTQRNIADAQKKIAGMTPQSLTQIKNLMKAEAKVTTGPGTKIAGEVTSDAIIQTKTGIFKITKEQLKEFPGMIKKIVVNNKMLSTLAVAGLTVYALYELFKSPNNESIILTDENGNPIDDTTKVGGEWLPCIQQMIKSKEGTMITRASGQISVLVKNSEFPGGLQYYANGRVMNTATKDMGSYTCKEGTVTINEVVGRILRERLLKEQGTEISDETMDKYVDDAVDDLDGYVAGYNLKSLKDILTSLKGKTYKGEDAIKKFLEFYKQDEGVDFVTDVKSVGVANLSVVAKNMKPEIIALATGASSNVPKPDNSNKSGGNSGTTIIWDKDKKKGGDKIDGGNKIDGGKPKKNKSQFHDCESKDFPLEFGCKSTKIAEIQKCLGVADDGKLGKNTMKAMEDNKYDTSRGLSEDVYRAILKACNPETKREKLEPITLAPTKGLKLADIARPDLKLKLNFNDIIRTPRKPTDLYKLFVDNGYIDADTGGTPLEDGTVLPSTRRVKYKGPELDESILSQMDEVMSGMGYTRIKQKLDKNYGSKYVWLKN